MIGVAMGTAKELAEKVKARQAQLDKANEGPRSISDHVAHCSKNFDYSGISGGDSKGIALIIDEIKGK
jgi:hypothetical protein